MGRSSGAVDRVTRGILSFGALVGLAVVAYGLAMRSIDPPWSAFLLKSGGALALAFGLAALLPRTARVYACVTVAATAFALVAFDVFLAFAPPSGAFDAIAARQAATPGFDLRTRQQVVVDRRAAGTPSVPALFGINAVDDPERPDDLLPLIGLSSSNTVLCNETGQFAIFDSDAHGHRNPSIPDEVDVLLVGDSFMQGQCVAAGKDLAGLLRARGYSVYNIASSGNGPLLNLAALLEYGLAKKPKVVLWGYAGNDPMELRHEMLQPRLRQYLEAPDALQNLVTRQSEIDAYWRAHLERAHYFETVRPKAAPKPAAPTLRQLATLYHLRRRLGLRRTERGAWQETFRRTLSLAKAKVEAQGGQMFFVPFPYFEMVTAPRPDERRSIFEIVRPTGVAVVDLDKPFIEHADPASLFPLEMPGHFSEAGYALVADVVQARALGPKTLAVADAEP